MFKSLGVKSLNPTTIVIQLADMTLRRLWESLRTYLLWSKIWFFQWRLSKRKSSLLNCIPKRIITTLIKCVRRVLVNQGSAINILPWKVYEELSPRENLSPYQGNMIEFHGETIDVKGIAKFAIILGTPLQVYNNYWFCSCCLPLAYNVVLGRFSLNIFKDVMSTIHLIMKFPTLGGTRILKGDAEHAHECYIASLLWDPPSITGNPTNCHSIFKKWNCWSSRWDPQEKTNTL